MKHYTFKECGCKFPIKNENPLRFHLDLHIDNIPLDCPKVWRMLQEDKLCGIFQLDSNHSEHICHQFKPRNIEELAIVVALSRPGAIEGMYEGKSIKDRVIDRRHYREENTPIDDSIKDILSPTYQMMVFQEQTALMVQKLAGFNLEDAVTMTKAIGKKKADLMAGLKKQFIDGCKKIGIIDDERADNLFEMIRKAQRYLFNKNHSLAYALNSYQTAYCKAHLPKAYFTSWISYHKDKDEIFKLVQNAKLLDVDVYPPNISLMNYDCQLHKHNIYIGLIDIKDTGETTLSDMEFFIRDTEKKIGEIGTWQWEDFLMYVADNVNSRVVKAVICSGALDLFKVDRYRMLYEYEHYTTLKDKEKNFILKDRKSNPSLKVVDLVEKLVDAPTGRKEGSGCSSKRRLESVKGILDVLKNPPFLLQDSVAWISSVEEDYIGIPLTCTKVDECDIGNANCDCKTFLKGYRRPGLIIIGCNVGDVREIITKNKKKMAFTAISDITGCIDKVVVFPDKWHKFSDILVNRNTVMIAGKRGDKDKNSFIVENVWQI